MKEQQEIPSVGKHLLFIDKIPNTMKLTWLFLSASVFGFTAQASAQRMSVALDNAKVEHVLEEITEQTGLGVAYSDQIVDLNRRVSIHLSDAEVNVVLDKLTEGTTLGYDIRNGKVYLYAKSNKHNPGTQQSNTVTGVVVDANGEPIIGANVVVKGTTNGTITDIDGRFSLEAPGNAVLSISYIGYNAQDIKIGNRSSIKITLKEDTQKLDEVIVVGYGTMKKSDLTGSVASLKSDEIVKGFSLSPDMALRGKTAGVQIVTQSGQPGAGGVVRIRGNSSILGSNEPLYVVDGVPLSGGDAAEGVDGVSSSPLTTINPSDIESMEILKDASATAIYGSRGANGVVMITTKRGKEGRFSANLNVSAGFQQIGHKLELTTPQQWAVMWNEAMDYLNNGVGKYDVNNLPAQTDWIDAGYRTALLQNYELSFSGGTEKLRYMISGGYSDQEGIVKGTDFTRYSLRTNLENKFNGWLSVGVNISATKTETNSIAQGSIDGGNPLGYLTMACPVEPIYDENGDYNLYIDAESRKGNPYASLSEITNNDSRNRFISNVYADLTFLPELKFRTSLAIDVNNSKAKYYAPSYIAEGLTNQGVAKIGNSNSIYWNSTNTLTYIKDFEDGHSLNAMVGAEWQKSQIERNFTQGIGFANDNAKFDNISEATTFTSRSNFTGWQMESYMTRINYSFKNKYSFTFTGRLDGSSRFGANNKYAFFPSGAFAWRMSEEDFIKNFSHISNMKLRLSYGSSGEQGIPAGLEIFSKNH